MSSFYVDTSALAKRYLTETGSAWLRAWIAPAAGHTVLISELTPVEMFSLLERRQREGSLLAADARLLQLDFLAHAQTEYVVVPFTSAALLHARTLVQRHPLRTLDAVQLSCALQVATVARVATTFMTSDKNLLAAAAAEGFEVDDPNAYP